ncbi:MAG: hydroxylase [Betaproteobacteria bacterium RIFCSPLOWO2_12_FULL_63_13]|nr:MAG: hydroxylase [Betaproteobacteria bacterium RIFCSPLOWO2_02_FULL_63_19]OGA42763.1 MAG: hydroxylase [Betaproteobacteria bacterium RIFCSPLOWO2_12_FULL_63_13]
MATQPTMPTEDDVREALRSVDDPEVGINIVDLGLVYHVDLGEKHVRIELTMTTPACPMGDYITDNVRRSVGALLPDGVAVDVELVWDPIWTPDRMSESAKQAFGWPH